MTPLQQLAQELKEAAQKYTKATGQKFEVDFEFLERRSIQDTSPTYSISLVTVKATKETQA